MLTDRGRGLERGGLGLDRAAVFSLKSTANNEFKGLISVYIIVLTLLKKELQNK